jgi:hypothetical protein
MAANIETHSNEKDVGSLQSSVNQQNARLGAARVLDERRRAALSQIDNASFSLVLFDPISFLVLTSHFAVGSISRLSVSLVLASSPMRKWCEGHYLIVYL